MIATAPIGVLDSGLGGLSLLPALHAELPQESLCYVADSGNAPYGDRCASWITERSAQIIRFLERQGCKAVVIACNTITAIAVERLRRRFDIPIIAIEPAIKPAVALSRSGVVAVLATTRTLGSDSLQRLRERHGDGRRVLFVPCPGLADHVERGELHSPGLLAKLRDLLTPALEQGADTLVLGCTHYPFLIDAIAEVAGPQVRIIDPSPAVAAEVRRRLAISGTLNPGRQRGRITLWSSASSAESRHLAGRLSGLHVAAQLLPPLP